MRVATACSIALVGAEGHLIDVQVAVSQGTVGTSVVGRPDASLHEARDRVRMAINNSAPTPKDTWPATFRVTILLAPADLPKSGTHFDLAIAVGRPRGLRCGAGVVPGRHGLHRRAVAVRQPAPGGRGAAHGHRGVRARDPPGVRPGVAGPRGGDGPGHGGLRHAVAGAGRRRAQRRGGARRGPGRRAGPHLAAAARAAAPSEPLDLDDLDGMEDAKYALEVAAAGGHHLMLNGPRGAGKTSLAERLPTILPDLTTEQALEVTALHSLAGLLRDGDGLVHRPPVLRSPPRRQQGQRGRRWHRSGPARRHQPRPPRRALPRRVPALPRRRRRRAAPAARER